MGFRIFIFHIYKGRAWPNGQKAVASEDAAHRPDAEGDEGHDDDETDEVKEREVRWGFRIGTGNQESGSHGGYNEGGCEERQADAGGLSIPRQDRSAGQSHLTYQKDEAGDLDAEKGSVGGLTQDDGESKVAAYEIETDEDGSVSPVTHSDGGGKESGDDRSA